MGGHLANWMILGVIFVLLQATLVNSQGVMASLALGTVFGAPATTQRRTWLHGRLNPCCPPRSIGPRIRLPGKEKSLCHRPSGAAQ
jgi:hypothetical protein